MSLAPESAAFPVAPVHPPDPHLLDYEQLSMLVADRIAPEVADVVASRVAEAVREATGSVAGPQRHLKEKKRRERCRAVQVSI
jgi:hypothetical protein